MTILERVVIEVKGNYSKNWDWEWLEYKEEDRIEVNSPMFLWTASIKVKNSLLFVSLILLAYI